jgi:predicted TIM-barrel fold metal-dependent hydrolase
MTLALKSIIDCHLHLHGKLEEIAALDSLPVVARASGLERINCLSCTSSATHLDDERSLDNLILAQAKLKYPELLYTFGGLYHCLPQGGPTLGEQVRLLVALGFDGIKMLEGKPTVYKTSPYPLDAAVYHPFYTYCAEAGVPILFHVADPEEFWDPALVPDWAKKYNWTYDAAFPVKEELYRQVDHILGRFPGLKIIFAHFYFLSADLPRAASFLDTWPGVSFDLTPGTELYFNFSKKHELWRDFFIKYQDRILFGTDNFDTSKVDDAARHISIIRQFLETDRTFDALDGTMTDLGLPLCAWNGTLQGLGLPPDVLEKIYYRNFLRYAGNRPKKLNRELALGAGKAVLDPAGKTDMGKILQIR